MFDVFLVPKNTVVTTKGDGPVVDVSAAESRTLLLVLKISNVVEQESIDVTVWGSPDGQTWGAKPLTSFPQKFYVCDRPILLDFATHPEVKFLRVHWEVNRWGRGSETPMFEFGVRATEVGTELLR